MTKKTAKQPDPTATKRVVSPARPRSGRAKASSGRNPATVKVPAASRPKAPTGKIAIPPTRLPTPSRVTKVPLKHFLARAGAPSIDLVAGTEFTFGRNDDCSLPIPSTRVSRVHAAIEWRNSKPVLVDRGSANGTFVGGRPVTEHALAPGDEIEIGPFLCVYRQGDGTKAAAAPLGERTMMEPVDLLGGKIQDGGGLAEVLQGIAFNAKTGTLFVFSPEGQGWVTFSSGNPQAAEAGDARDAEAIYTLLAIKEGRFSFTGELKTDERRMKISVTSLLLEWGRRADELGR